jgi:dipeptidyl aminopeptidase/acylaminoacyl peptidase
MPGQVVCIAGSPTQPKSVIRLNPDSQQIEVLRRSNENSINPAYISIPKSVEFPTEQGLKSHAFYYSPKNRDYLAPAAERPPLLVMSHGGPTSSASMAFNLTIQYWTSRGIAVLDVNYGGSTGYGRVYRQRLNGQWGIVDVNDCVNGAIHLVNLQKVDANRLAIRGGSAGGYTTLCALTFRNIFKAGASYYGISDLEKLAKETHKFESRYMDRLLGPYPECKDIYYDRSPINFADHIMCPVIFFQGLEDKIVPPNQTEMIFETIRSKRIPVSFFPFVGEQHGFRIAKNIKLALDAELYFYSRIFNFDLANEVDPVRIENM